MPLIPVRFTFDVNFPGVAAVRPELEWRNVNRQRDVEGRALYCTSRTAHFELGFQPNWLLSRQPILRHHGAVLLPKLYGELYGCVRAILGNLHQNAQPARHGTGSSYIPARPRQV